MFFFLIKENYHLAELNFQQYTGPEGASFMLVPSKNISIAMQ